MQRSYTVKGREVVLEIDESSIAVRFKEPATRGARAAATAASPTLGAFEKRTELPREKYTILPLKAGTGQPDRYSEAANQLRSEATVERIAEVFRIGDRSVLATERVTLGLAPEADARAVVSEHGLEIIESFGDNEAVVRLPSDVDPIELVNTLGQDPRVDYAEPDFVTIGSHIARRPEVTAAPVRIRASRAVRTPDPLMRDQYAIFITEADLARRRVTGSKAVRIAILDEGVDSTHPDLTASVTGTYDATDDDVWQEPKPWDAHGTACAGLAAAVGDNGEGIVGVGGGCSIMAVRIAFSERPNGPWITWNDWIRRAIDWCTENDADVLSNSWGGGVYSQAIVNAFERARTLGRNGRGAVVLVAAGNASSAVDFPGYLPSVLTVSASNECDEFKTRTSCDGEHWWGSNFGPEVDVAAPGVHNLTTDNQGRNGYDPSDYTDFNGTSSSTPIVAGACGLLLSADPTLLEGEVREIIATTADKVGQFPYRGGRNDQMGSGRLNVRRAVEEVLSRQVAVTRAARKSTNRKPARKKA